MNEEKYDYLSGIKLAHILRLRNTLVHGNYIVDEVGNKKIKYPGVRTDTIPLKKSFFSNLKSADYRLVKYIYNYLVSDNRLLNISNIDFDSDSKTLKIKIVDLEKNVEIDEVISLSEDNSSPIKSERIIKKKSEDDKIIIKKEIVYSNTTAIELIKLYSDEEIVRKDVSDSMMDMILRDLPYKYLWYRTINDIGVVTVISKEEGRLQRRGISSCDIATVDLSDTFDVREDDADISERYLNKCLELNVYKRTTSFDQLAFVRRLLVYYRALKNLRLNKEISESDEDIVECYNEEDKELEEFISTMDSPFESKESEMTK